MLKAWLKNNNNSIMKPVRTVFNKSSHNTVVKIEFISEEHQGTYKKHVYGDCCIFANIITAFSVVVIFI